MPTRFSPSPLLLAPPGRGGPRPLDERRDVKQESSFQQATSSVRRSLAKELMADRKR